MALGGLVFDGISHFLTLVIFFIAAITSSYSIRYLKGAKKERQFYYKLNALVIFLLLAISLDNIFFFISSWLLANLTLSSLMTLNRKWSAAQNSTTLSRNFFFASFALAITGALILTHFGQTSSLFELGTLQSQIPPFAKLLGVGSLFLSTLIQSGLFPFHRWIVSSLNSPTPVSAMMHAGLVNGGCIVLLRMMPVIKNTPYLMDSIFVFGIVSMVLGTMWNLCQTDFKRMLACSTVGQMGYMFVQLGLGLFPAALSHLALHGLFKSHLFLSAGSNLSPISRSKGKEITMWLKFFGALTAGACMAFAFSFTSGHSFPSNQSGFLLICLTAVAGFQASFTFLPTLNNGNQIMTLFKGWTLFTCIGILYGCSMRLTSSLIPDIASIELPLSPLHLLGLVALMLPILMAIPALQRTPVWKRLFFKLLNSSAPASKTMTTQRLDYNW
ncbi:MAG: proton-conducting transporter membrane subunit [Simkaniaceae bacterium]|nr:proton-conducting transporter membrane subunit [Candidatus Sacchlamyda saccharinae]